MSTKAGQVYLSIAGDSQSGLSAESANQIRMFHENTVRPLTGYIQRVLNRELLSYYSNIGLDVALEIILEDDEDEIAIMANKIAMLNAGIISRNEIREELELEEIEGGDVFTVVATGIQTLDAITATPMASGSMMPQEAVSVPSGSDSDPLATISPDDAHKSLLGVIKMLGDKLDVPEVAGTAEEAPEDEEDDAGQE